MSAPLRLLLLEDDVADAELTLGELRRSGFEVIWERVFTESDYRAALRQAAAGRAPDVILADYSLPQFDALQALRLLLESKLDIPFIIVTGALGEERAVECMRQGATDYLLKDRLGRLGSAVQRALDEKRLRDDKRAAELAEREQRTLAEALRDTAAALASSLNFDDVLDRILDNVGRVVPHDAANILLLETNGGGIEILRPVRTRGYTRGGARRFPFHLTVSLADVPYLQQMAATGQALVVSDTQADADWVTFPEMNWVRSYLGVPLRAQGQTLGLLNLDSAIPNFFTVEHAEHLQAFADQSAIALINAQLYDAAQRNAAELSALYRALTRLLAAGNDLPRLTRQITQILAEEFKLPHVGLLLSDETGRELRLAAQAGDPAAPLVLPLDGPGLTVAAARSGEPVFVPDVRADARYLLSNPQTVSEFDVPLRVADPNAAAGVRVIGVLNLESPSPDTFGPRERRTLAAFAESVALALENATLLTRLQLARQVAEEASQLKSEFLANTSHELRTPLTTILGSLQLVLEHGEALSFDDAEFVGAALAAAQRLTSLVDNLLDLTQLERGHLDVNLEPTHIAPLLEEICALLRPTAEARQLYLNLLVLPGADLPVWVAPAKLRQILHNLVSNAIKFTEQGGVTVLMQAHLPSRHLRVMVQDTGIGIPADKQSRLFQPFGQADGSSTRRHEGAGLGLEIARRLAELMGGELTLFSAGMNQGSTFTLSLALVDAASVSMRLNELA
jgi:signal transduction histidine kinase/CheY-like chemotaxis protein